jgi:hypothetical protein
MKSKQQFSHIIQLIENNRKNMADTNPFFKTLVNDSFSVEERMVFVPYLLFFSCGGPDVVTLLMRSEKQPQNLSFIEKKIKKRLQFPRRKKYSFRCRLCFLH